MKNLLLLLSLSLLFIYGCEKDGNHLLDSTGDDQLINKTNLYRMSILDKTIEVESVDKESIAIYLKAEKEGENRINQRNSNNHKAVGLLNAGDDMATFNAVQNKGGVHGNSHLSGPDLIDVKFDSECLLVLENKAYWGGTITVWEVSEELQFLPIDVGWQFLWSAIDNGEGSRSDPDEFGDAFIFIPPGLVATDFGFETWCDYADYDYNLLDESRVPPHFPHGHIPGDDPTNIQIN